MKKSQAIELLRKSQSSYRTVCCDMDLKELLDLTDELLDACEECAFLVAYEVLVERLTDFSRSVSGIETCSDSWMAALRVFVENKIGRRIEWKVNHPGTDLDDFIQELVRRNLPTAKSGRAVQNVE